MTYNVGNFTVTAEEVRAFQAVFPGSAASSVMDRLIRDVMIFWNGISMDVTVSDARLRQSQGALSVIASIDTLVAQILKIDLSREEDISDIEDEEEEEYGAQGTY